MAENSVLAEPASGKTTYRHENGTQIVSGHTTQLHLRSSEVMDMTPLISPWRCSNMAAMPGAVASFALAGPGHFEPSWEVEAPEDFKAPVGSLVKRQRYIVITSIEL